MVIMCLATKPAMLTIISVYFEYLIVAVVPFYSNSKNAKKSGKCSAKYWVDIFLQ